MLSLKQLSYALAVSKTLHFRKAAELCHVRQSTLSAGINELEKQLGLKIFERDNKKVLVTSIGSKVLDKAHSIMLQIEDMTHLEHSYSQPFCFPLTVGMIPTIAPYLLPKLLPELKRRYPDAKVDIVEEQSHVLVDMVHSGEIDTAVLALPYPCEGLLTLEFWQEDFYWVALRGETHTHQSEVTSQELQDANLMLLNEGHCLKDHILDACKLSSENAHKEYRATSLNTLIQMVMSGMGSTLIPQMALQQLITQYPILSAVHLNEPGPHRRIALAFRPNYVDLPSIEALEDIARQALSQN
ncbi:hydrogen peroxide-inducible genes activator [Vibrio hangzhouensis]|uniref:LysR family transcriptional regulator, hydrogen peroxide-inducible genes activator n=1 Tax=Vibrio hangzhouensis TaxID=462991 RepID=A0A1H5VAM5_9VIBR|nr:hydrogen peroxide-inducible genes activator [Vibrio hangzhouensis]SEF84244.1 LysR family transcriptional regulator, hydrogen peroxide-inducible genes activator [Vibrio hangzhouensis]